MGRRKSRHMLAESMSYEDQCRAAIIRDAVKRICHPAEDTHTPNTSGATSNEDKALPDVIVKPNESGFQRNSTLLTAHRAPTETLDSPVLPERAERASTVADARPSSPNAAQGASFPHSRKINKRIQPSSPSVDTSPASPSHPGRHRRTAVK